jgi:hypothetical protein
VLWKRHEIVVAADSLVTSVASDGTIKLKGADCKIHKAGRTYFAFAGFLCKAS